jgi:hypothetical protein
LEPLGVTSKEVKMKVALTAGALMLALAVPVLAETPQDVPGSTVQGMESMEKNPGALTAPEKKDQPAGANQSGGMSDDSSANVPGASADSDRSVENQGSLSAPEKDAQ